ncbi:MAG: hypothetical protein LPK09_09795 [Hymenobacteraceae bacterium]|nr:hypothetical protein [Hymenobacteraceae bacterium]
MKSEFKICILYLSFALGFVSCGPQAATEAMVPAESANGSIVVLDKADTLTAALIEEEADTVIYDYETYFIVVADTGLNYAYLQSKMYSLSKRLESPIDTMDRFYDESKNLIKLPEDYEDEVFAGDYYPRRFPSKSMSLEYLDLYQRKAGEKTIALVTGIFASDASADSALAILKTAEPKGFKIQTSMYIGCIH